MGSIKFSNVQMALKFGNVIPGSLVGRDGVVASRMEDGIYIIIIDLFMKLLLGAFSNKQLTWEIL